MALAAQLLICELRNEYRALLDIDDEFALE